MREGWARGGRGAHRSRTDGGPGPHRHAVWTWRAQEPHTSLRPGLFRAITPILTSPGAFLVRKAHYLHFTPTMFPSPSSAPSAYGRPSTAKGHDAAPLDGGRPSGRPRPGSARARRPPRWAGRGTKRGIGAPYGRPPLRWAGRGPRIRMISRRSLPAQRPPHAGISAVGRAVGLCTPAPQPLDQAATAPAVRAPPHAQADTDDDQLSARMPGAPPSKIAALSPIPRAVGASPPRRTTTGARLRPGSALVPRGTGAGLQGLPRRGPAAPRTRRMPPLNDRTH